MNFEGHNSVHSNDGKNLYADTHTEMEARRRKKEKDVSDKTVIQVQSTNSTIHTKHLLYVMHYAWNWGLNDSHNPLQFQCDDIYENSGEDIDTKRSILKIEKFQL